MRVAFVMMATLLAIASLPAQSGDPGKDSSKNVPAGPDLLQGCLQSSGGHYTLTDKDGKLHDLTGDTARLSHDVGHQVELRGKPVLRTIDTTEQNAASTVVERPAFSVTASRQVAATCSSSKK